MIHNILFGTTPKGEREQWRDALHENKNETMRSTGAARISKDKSDEALEVQKKALRLLECIKDNAGKK
jgi:uncharacterized protein (DUF2225 family)